jgi:hypothetical protein
MDIFFKSKLFPAITALLLCLGLPNAASANIALFDYGFNIDGTTTLNGAPLPSAIDASGFDFSTGLGSIGITVSGTGAHSVTGFFDHEIDEPINTFFNETGSTTGAPAAGQSWEIDEPGFANGDIFENFQAGALDNGIGTSVYGDTTFPDDVSMAVGWDFVLALGEQAMITFALVDMRPSSGFFLEHNDPDSQESIFLSSTLGISPVVSAIPVPAAIWLFGSGLLGLIGFSRRKPAA